MNNIYSDNKANELISYTFLRQGLEKIWKNPFMLTDKILPDMRTFFRSRVSELTISCQIPRHLLKDRVTTKLTHFGISSINFQNNLKHLEHKF